MVIDSEPNNVSPETIQQAVTSLDKYILEHYGKPTKRTLRERQITVIEDLRDTLRGGQTEGYVTIPTGVGKTVLFTEAVEAFNEVQPLETLVVVPTKILARQTRDKFQEFASDIEVGMLYSDEHDLTKTVTITTYTSLVRHIASGTLTPELYRILVLDEVHRSLSTKRIAAIVRFNQAIKIGFTATPTYSENRQVANLLNTEIHKMGLREAVEKDLLSPFSAIIAQTDVDLSSISIKSSGDYDERELEVAINTAARNQAAVDLYNKMFSDETAVAYCNSVDHAQNLAKMFRDNGVSAGYISGYQDRREQVEVLRRFHEGEIKILCNADILIEGFDEPRASVCLNLKPTRSVVVAQQRAGRVLRKNLDDPDKHAVVVDFLDKTQDPRRQPVTFAEVAEAAIILTKSGNNGASGGTRYPGGGIDFPPLGEIEISGLKVVVNPQEVMKIVKETQEKLYQAFNPLEEISLGIENLYNLFKGSYYKILGALEVSLNILNQESSETIIFRTVNGKPIRVISKDLYPRFIELMKEGGIVLKESIPPNYNSEQGFAVTSHNLSTIFRSKHSIFYPKAMEVIKIMSSAYPNRIGQSRIGNNIAPIIPEDLLPNFITLMKDRGMLVKSEDTPDKFNPDEELNINISDLNAIFRGGYNKLKPILEAVVIELEKESIFVSQRISRKGSRPIKTLPKNEYPRFVELMLANGAELKEDILN